MNISNKKNFLDYVNHYDLYLLAFIDRKCEEKNKNFPEPISQMKLNYHENKGLEKYKNLKDQKKELEENLEFYSKEFKKMPGEHKSFMDKRIKKNENLRNKVFMIYVYLLIFMIVINLGKIAYRLFN